eukprot:GDKI01012064.1.p1 GENE.GDKI01012064.1~~GDKI01012064.1.p1  ORF type:complete len:431 (-),score=102.52 GDKI01012064.1:112-1404(-)
MFFGGGFGHDHGYGRRRAVDTTKFYTSLGVSKDADPNDIKKAYRKAALQHHPDRGGDAEKFKEIGRAYEVLSDPEKRRRYDMFGEDGIDGSGGGSDFYENAFRPQARRPEPPRKKRGEDAHHTINVTLENLYTGMKKKFAVWKDVVCDGCNGQGGPASALRTCTGCNGRGMRVVVRQTGPIMSQQTVTCTECKGKGQTIPQDRKCAGCRGSGCKREKRVLDVFIDKGAPDATKYSFKGESDERPNEIPGDVIFVINELKHSTFTRKGADLHITRNLTLLEALVGYAFELKHLDGRSVVVKSKEGEVIKPGDVKVIREEGLPIHKSPYEHGHLYVTFQVEFPLPHQLSLQQKQGLMKCLPRPRHAMPTISKDTETFVPQNASARDIGSTQTGYNRYKQQESSEEEEEGNDEYEEATDDEDPRTQQQQCRQQ